MRRPSINKYSYTPWRRRIYGRGDGRDEADGADRAGDAPTNGDNAVTNLSLSLHAEDALDLVVPQV